VPNQMSLGQRVKGRRLHLGMTQAELAKVLEVTPQHISAIEQDKRVPSLTFLARLAEKLGVTTDYIITGKEQLLPDTALVIRADKDLPIEIRKALITMIKALREAKKG
jgi:transcriptional regulator with XRE-family HTH domain